MDWNEWTLYLFYYLRMRAIIFILLLLLSVESAYASFRPDEQVWVAKGCINEHFPHMDRKDLLLQYFEAQLTQTTDIKFLDDQAKQEEVTLRFNREVRFANLFCAREWDFKALNEVYDVLERNEVLQRQWSEPHKKAYEQVVEIEVSENLIKFREISEILPVLISTGLSSEGTDIDSLLEKYQSKLSSNKIRTAFEELNIEANITKNRQIASVLNLDSPRVFLISSISQDVSVLDLAQAFHRIMWPPNRPDWIKKYDYSLEPWINAERTSLETALWKIIQVSLNTVSEYQLNKDLGVPDSFQTWDDHPVKEYDLVFVFLAEEAPKVSCDVKDRKGFYCAEDRVIFVKTTNNQTASDILSQLNAVYSHEVIQWVTDYEKGVDSIFLKEGLATALGEYAAQLELVTNNWVSKEHIDVIPDREPIWEEILNQHSSNITFTNYQKKLSAKLHLTLSL